MSLFSWYRDTKKTPSNSNSKQKGYTNNFINANNAKTVQNTSMWPIAKTPLSTYNTIKSNKVIPSDHALITIPQVNKSF